MPPSATWTPSVKTPYSSFTTRLPCTSKTSSDAVPASGRQNGTVQSAGCETDPYDESGLVIALDVQLDSGEIVTCRHSTTGKYCDITREIVEGPLGLDWPYGIEKIGSVVGRTVPVSVKHLDRGGYRAYIATKKKGENMDAATVKRAVARLAGDPNADDVPF